MAHHDWDRNRSMQSSMGLLRQRRFLPLFITQLLGAFNDNLFKNAMVFLIVYDVYQDPAADSWFSAIATAVFILPFFVLSAASGQLADARDKARIIRIVKAAEIVIMVVGATGLLMAWQGVLTDAVAIPLMMLALFAMGVHSTFFGPIKYAILPQHLDAEEVLGGTGLVEAGTYIAILLGTIVAGLIPVEVAAALVMLTALVGYATGRYVPAAPPEETPQPIDWNVWRASITLVSATMHIPRLFLAILSISFFWTVGAVLFIQFPVLAENILTADKPVASLFLAVFSIGIAIGSVAINRLLKSEVSARYGPASVIVMGGFVLWFWWLCGQWQGNTDGTLLSFWDFLDHDMSWMLTGSLLGIAVFGGMFVVPLYAFLTTTVPKSQAARTVAANNIVNSGFMVCGALVVTAMNLIGIDVVNQLLLSAVMCVVSAALAWKLHLACD